MENRNMESESIGMPLSADALAGELMEETNEAVQQETAQLEDEIREGIAALFEDGWTPEELAALSQDEQVREDVAAGTGVVRAAAKMLRRELAAMRQSVRRRGVPVSRATAAGHVQPGNRIDAMSDAQFDAFSRQARAAAMMGRKVRM